MDWTIIWDGFLGGVGGASALILAAIWIGKKWFSARVDHAVRHEYDKKLADYQLGLSQSSAQALRNMERQLQNAIDRKLVDKSLFLSLTETLPSSGSIAFIKSNNYAGFSFLRDRHLDLERFIHEWDDVEHEFLDEELEALRSALLSSATEFLEYLALNTWGLKNNTDSATVPPEWEHQQPERFTETVETIHRLARMVVGDHEQLIRFGRSKLEVLALPSRGSGASSSPGSCP